MHHYNEEARGFPTHDRILAIQSASFPTCPCCCVPPPSPSLACVCVACVCVPSPSPSSLRSRHRANYGVSPSRPCLSAHPWLHGCTGGTYTLPCSVLHCSLAFQKNPASRELHKTYRTWQLFDHRWRRGGYNLYSLYNLSEGTSFCILPLYHRQWSWWWQW